MNDLNTLLDRAAGPAVPTGGIDVRADLTRGHRALSRTRRRRGATGLLGVAAAGVVGVGLVRVTAPDDQPSQAVERGQGAGLGTAGQPAPAQQTSVGPYTFDVPPEGWEVQGATAHGVTIARVGAENQSVDSFLGKLVILFDETPLSGEQVVRDGRTFWVRGDSGHGTIATPTRPGEPEGNVLVQYPDGIGWTRDEMIAFLAGVRVGDGALPGAG